MQKKDLPEDYAKMLKSKIKNDPQREVSLLDFIMTDIVPTQKKYEKVKKKVEELEEKE